ncbi:MAG: nitrile hydratase accessory protein [Alphaproteobacteria bacterium]
MSAPDQDPLGPLARRDDEPVFDEPWQAQVLGVAYSLVDRGLFSAQDWSEALGARLRHAASDGAADNAATYYGAVLATLEALTAAEGTVTGSDMAARREAWRRAYLRTPHGKPVLL